MPEVERRQAFAIEAGHQVGDRIAGAPPGTGRRGGEGLTGSDRK
jgi:hypothetical protein